MYVLLNSLAKICNHRVEGNIKMVQIKSSIEKTGARSEKNTRAYMKRLMNVSETRSKRNQYCEKWPSVVFASPKGNPKAAVYVCM